MNNKQYKAWCSENEYQIRQDIESQGIAWLHAHCVDFDTNDAPSSLTIGGWQSLGRANSTRNKDKASYIAESGNTDGTPWLSIRFNCFAGGGLEGDLYSFNSGKLEIVKTLYAESKENFDASDLAENKKRREREKEAREAREAEKAAREVARAAVNAKREQAAKEAQKELDAFETLVDTGQNGYFDEKGITGAMLSDTGARFGKDKFGDYAAILLINCETDEPQNIQKFYAPKPGANNKWPLKGAAGGLKGACHVIGDLNDCELITYHESFIDAVVAYNCLPKAASVTVLNTNGFEAVNKVFRERYPAARHVNVADNDRFKYDHVDNAGVLSAASAARNHDGDIAIPSFDVDSKGKDLWDLWHEQGAGAVIELIEDAMLPPKGLAWHIFKLENTGLYKPPKGTQGDPLERIKKAYFGYTRTICKNYPENFVSREKIESLASNVLNNCQERLGNFPEFDLKTLTKYAENQLARAFVATAEAATKDFNDSLLKPDQFYDNKPIMSFLDELVKNSTLAIDGNIASGKTHLLTQYLLDAIKEGTIKSVLFVYPRSRLSKNIVERLNRAGLSFVDYNDVKMARERGQEPPETDFMSICTNSLTNTSLIALNQEYDCIIFDEGESNLGHLSGGTMSLIESTEVTIRMRELTRLAKKVFWFEANLTELTRYFLVEQCGRDLHVIRSDATRLSPRPHVYVKNKDVLTKRLNDHLSENKTAIVSCSFKKKCESLYDSSCKNFPNKRFLLITADTKGPEYPEQDVFLEDASNAGDYLAVFHTSSLESGVSIDMPHFDQSFGFYNTRTSSPESMSQSSYRARLTNQINAYVDAPIKAIKTRTMILNELLANKEVAVKYLNNTLMPMLLSNAGRNVPTPSLSELFNIDENIALHIEVEYSKQLKGHNALRRLVQIQKRMGFDDPVFDDCEGCDDERDEGKELSKDGKTITREKSKVEYLQAKEIDASQYEILNKKQGCNHAEIWAMRRYQLERAYQINLSEFDSENNDAAVDKLLYSIWNGTRHGLKAIVAIEAWLLPEERFDTKVRSRVMNSVDDRTDYSQITKRLVLTPIMKSIGFTFDQDGLPQLPPENFTWRYSDFEGTPWYKWILENYEYVNLAFGCRFNPNDSIEINAKYIGVIIRSLGFETKSERVYHNAVLYLKETMVKLESDRVHTPGSLLKNSTGVWTQNNDILPVEPTGSTKAPCHTLSTDNPMSCHTLSTDNPLSTDNQALCHTLSTDNSNWVIQAIREGANNAPAISKLTKRKPDAIRQQLARLVKSGLIRIAGKTGRAVNYELVKPAILTATEAPADRVRQYWMPQSWQNLFMIGVCHRHILNDTFLWTKKRHERALDLLNDGAPFQPTNYDAPSVSAP
ncbi:MAG: hypothetical protein VSS75_019285, partial [Candidatus Parabeggiatoa sp.]